MTNKPKKGSLLLSESTLLLFDRMTDEEGLTFIRLIRNYHKDGSLPPSGTDRLISISFDVFRADYDADQKKYWEKVKRIEAVNENRQKATSCENVTTSCENVTTSCENAPNTYHTNAPHDNTSKESKPKKDVSLNLSQEEKFNNWMRAEFPHLVRMEKPLTFAEFNELNDKGFDFCKINEKLNCMENDKKVPKQKRSCYRTLLKWLENDRK